MEAQDRDIPRTLEGFGVWQGLWDAVLGKERIHFHPFFSAPQNYCPKEAKRSSGITSSTWQWGTTGSR